MPKNNPEKDYEENERDEKKKIGDSPLTQAQEKNITNQVDEEHILCWDSTQAQRATSLKRLKLYNNQKKDQDKVGDPLLFTVFQTVFSELNNDLLRGKFSGREEGDDEVAENLNAMADYDYSVMEKDIVDYEWNWDACFFPGGGLLLLNEFDRKEMVPVAEVIDPMTFIKDPRATSINGNQKGYGAARFFGREIGKTKSELKAHKVYFNIDRLKKDKDLKELKDEASEARKDAQGLDQTKYKEESLGENYEYNLLEWFTHIKGEKYLITLGNNRKQIVRYQKLDKDKWSVIQRQLFPISHDNEGVTIPDLIEDKQRARSVMINLGMESAKADLYPMYLFDKKKIPNPNDLDFAFNKFVPIDGSVDKAVTPIQKSVFHQQVNLILNILDTAAQKAVAAPEVSQGVQPKQDRTLGETEKIVAGKNVRHSLGMRVFGWSERRYWRQYYSLYKKNFKEEIDEKIVRLQGPLGATWRTFTRENLIAKIDPDVSVEITSDVEAKRAKDFQEFSAFSQIAMQDPQTNRRFVLRNLGKIMGMNTAKMTMMFPPTIDEMRAEDENRQIDKNALPKINAMDDDVIHIEIHNKAKDAPAKLAHIEAHKFMMMKKKENAELFPPTQQMPMDYNPVNQPKSEPAMAGAQSGRKQGQEEL